MSGLGIADLIEDIASRSSMPTASINSSGHEVDISIGSGEIYPHDAQDTSMYVVTKHFQPHDPHLDRLLNSPGSSPRRVFDEGYEAEFRASPRRSSQILPWSTLNIAPVVKLGFFNAFHSRVSINEGC